MGLLGASSICGSITQAGSILTLMNAGPSLAQLRSGEDQMAQHLTLTVNGQAQTIEVDDPDMPLLYALRDDLGLNNPRFGCGLGQCGACTEHIDGRPARSCVR